MIWKFFYFLTSGSRMQNPTVNAIRTIRNVNKRRIKSCTTFTSNPTCVANQGILPSWLSVINQEKMRLT